MDRRVEDYGDKKDIIVPLKVLKIYSVIKNNSSNKTRRSPTNYESHVLLIKKAYGNQHDTEPFIQSLLTVVAL